MLLRTLGGLTLVPGLLFFSLHNLGGAEEEVAGVAASIPHHMRALEVALARGQSLWVAYARHDLALAYRELDDRDAAPRVLGHVVRGTRRGSGFRWRLVDPQRPRGLRPLHVGTALTRFRPAPEAGADRPVNGA